jgi:hypothetical protein
VRKRIDLHKSEAEIEVREYEIMQGGMMDDLIEPAFAHYQAEALKREGFV